MDDNKDSIKLLIASALLLVFLILYIKFSDTAILNKEMLKNLKYTTGTISTDRFYSKSTGDGYDYEFYTQKGIKETHADGNFIKGRKYLVVYDSVNIKNGFMILEGYDITDSLKNKNINEREGWSIDKIPFGFDKKSLNEEVTRSIIKITK
ncbi:hypothetical protein [Chryseobacterium aureum]|uniref:hypothetical protein n=1 Tax=Chryseobacterium aureum TaxID=2497456 RepID=UPI000F8999B5|nr:hypothetical protein [Chryseobacterium aureum]